MESPFNQIALRSPFFDTGVFTPLSLFSASEPGAWYDPSDMSTMFQDAAGTTPVTAVEQPVSLLLDKSKSLALGSELVTNGDFSNGTTGWSALTDSGSTATLSVVSGALQTTFTGTAARAGAYQTITTVVGKWYTVTGSAAHITGADRNASIRIGTGSGNLYTNYTIIASSSAITSSTLTSFVVTFLATNTSTTILLVSGGAGTTGTFTDQFDNISVKELAGSHAYTPSGATASRPVLSARYNLLTKTEQFDDAAWTKGNCTITQNAGVAPDGTTTADTLVENTANAAHVVFQAPSVLTSGTYRFATYIKANGRNFASIKVANTGTTNQWAAADFDLVNLASVTVAGAGGQFTGLSATILDAGNGWRFCTLTFTSSSSISNVGIQSTTSAAPSHGSFGDVSFVGSGADALLIWGADYRVSNDGVALPAYQRVNTSTDYDTTNFPMYLRFDGSDDYMLTGTITPGTDKAQVFAGVRKLSDAAAGILVETSATRASNAGAFTFFAPGAAAPTYLFATRGSIDPASTTGASTFTSPITNIVTGLGDISADLDNIRVNGTVFVVSTSDQGTGNYLAYPMYIGRRAGTSTPFNGRLYGMIVRFGANLDNTQITNTETWMNGKTKAY